MDPVWAERTRIEIVDDDGRVVLREPDGSRRTFQVPRHDVPRYRRLLAFERWATRMLGD
jgi:hypothetical protein